MPSPQTERAGGTLLMLSCLPPNTGSSAALVALVTSRRCHIRDVIGEILIFDGVFDVSNRRALIDGVFGLFVLHVASTLASIPMLMDTLTQLT